MRKKQRQQYAAALPLSTAQMAALFNFVDDRLQESECDNTLRHTVSFLQKHQFPQEPVLAWLRNAGGYCDCEVIFNAEEEFESGLGA